MNPEMYAAMQLIHAPQRNFARSALPDAPLVPDRHRSWSTALRRLRDTTWSRRRGQRYLLAGNVNSPASC